MHILRVVASCSELWQSAARCELGAHKKATQYLELLLQCRLLPLGCGKAHAGATPASANRPTSPCSFSCTLLHLSTRTLQRRLTEQGLTFQRLLDEARRELARHYLVHSSRELNETAYLLGYEDANSFFRAFHHWEGTTPGQWRLLQQNSRTTSKTRIGAA